MISGMARIVGALAILSVCTLVACHGDRRESFYPSLADAEKAGAIDRGWVPDFLPMSSHSIHEVHDPSPSTTWCAFEFPPGEPRSFRKHLDSAEAPAASIVHIQNPDTPWWPRVLTGNLSEEGARHAGFDLYVTVQPETPLTKEVLIFAVDWKQGRAHFFRTRE